jgi:hypothetical protein
MFLTSNLRRLQNIHRIVAVVLLIAYPISYFWFDQGSVVAFVVTYLSCCILPTWYSWKLLDRWSNSKPLINETTVLHEVGLPISELRRQAERLVQQRRWRVKKQTTEEGIYRIVIETPISLYSFGENIRITANLAKGYAENMRIESAPKVPTTEVDDGRNRANVEAIRSALETDQSSNNQVTISGKAITSAKKTT